jgi:hypothetical protein
LAPSATFLRVDHLIFHWMASPGLPPTVDVIAATEPYPPKFASGSPIGPVPPTNVELGDTESPVAVLPSTTGTASSSRYGLTSLRTATGRGNILVVGNAIDPRALERELKNNCCRCYELQSLPATFVRQLIQEDPELTPHSKETALQLLPFYSGDDCYHSKMSCLHWTGLVWLLCAVSMLIPAVVVDIDMMVIISLALLSVPPLLYLIIGACWLCASRERQRLETELTGGRSGRIVNQPLMAQL